MLSASKQLEPLSPRARMIGMWLLLAALSMLFLAGMLGYVLIRLGAPNRPPTGALQIPWSLGISTFILLAGSLTIERAVRSLEHEKQQAFRSNLLYTLLLTIAFVAIQTPSLLSLLAIHGSASSSGITLYGLVFVLILLHALHIVGGLIPLVVTVIHASRDGYDHENVSPIRALAMYWHFLDAVWMVMLGVFLVLR